MVFSFGGNLFRDFQEGDLAQVQAANVPSFLPNLELDVCRVQAVEAYPAEVHVRYTLISMFEM